MENTLTYNTQQQNNSIRNAIPPTNQISNSVGRSGANVPNDVIVVQNLLKSLGYLVPVNGVISNPYNDPTILALLNFQSNNSIRVSGLILPNDTTFTRMLAITNGATNLQEGEDESLHQPFITNSFTFRRNAGNANTLNVIFEGDSWLDYPISGVLDLYDTITNRNQSLNLNCLHLAKFGETTSDMYNDRSRFVQYISNYRIDRIYFSGGGNDVFPNLGRIINRGTTTFSPNFLTDASKLVDLQRLSGDDLFRQCVSYKGYLNTTAFDTALFNSTNLTQIFSGIYANYIAFGSIINNNCTPNLLFYMHSYDYPMYKLGVRPVNIPYAPGPWIQPVFNQLGITDPILQSFIIIRLLDKFYSLLNRIKSEFTARHYQFQTRIIDFRGLLNSSYYWKDEIHPNSAGAQRLATRVTF